MKLEDFLLSIQTGYPSVSKDDAEAIVSEVLRIVKLDLYLYKSKELTKSEITEIDLMLFNRAENEPLQYIFGKTHFRNLVLEVGKGVLIPRPETELLVDIALSLIKDITAPEVCDIGTGSGAIALAIASESVNSTIKGIDISREALKYAEKNKLKNRVGNVDFLFGDLLSPFEKMDSPRQFHLITANLPYVSDELYSKLSPEVRSFEPEIALVSGKDGLDLIRKTAEFAKKHLYPQGHIIFEFSPEQHNPILELLYENNYINVRIEKDLNNRSRFAVANI
jgi:release factor glutamine methyltransferase